MLLLLLVGILNYLDRLVPAILAEPIKQDLALSDTVLGLLTRCRTELVPDDPHSDRPRPSRQPVRASR